MDLRDYVVDNTIKKYTEEDMKKSYLEAIYDSFDRGYSDEDIQNFKNFIDNLNRENDTTSRSNS